jgi:hypothetical protein
MTFCVLAAQLLGALVVYPRLTTQSALTRIATAFLLGQNLLALIWLCLGLVSLLRLFPIVVVLLTIVIWGSIRHGREIVDDKFHYGYA